MDRISTVHVTALGNDVGGISVEKGRETLFIQGALPGETVRCKTTLRRKNWSEAEMIEIIDASPYRVTPSCRYFGECGGCSIAHLLYERQLFWKGKWVEKALERMNIEFPIQGIEDVTPSPETLGYRNRVSFDITGGRPGLHRHRGDTMPVESCPLLNDRGGIQFRKLSTLDLDGVTRISVRASDRTGRSMLEFTGGLPPEHLLRDGTLITAWDLGDGWHTEPADSQMEEMLAGLRFPIKPGTFFQINPGAADILIDEVTSRCKGDMKILDLYGGSGTFAIAFASKGAKAVSVELVSDSSSSGEAAARMNGISGVRFINSSTRHFLSETVNKGEKWDAVIVDPPRSGLGLRLSRLLGRITADRIVYVSCNPFSLARDLSVITRGDWNVLSIKPIDMFPQTDHLEIVVELARKERT